MQAEVREKQRGFSSFASLSYNFIAHQNAAAMLSRASTNTVSTSAIANVETLTALFPRQKKFLDKR